MPILVTVITLVIVSPGNAPSSFNSVPSLYSSLKSPELITISLGVPSISKVKYA